MPSRWYVAHGPTAAVQTSASLHEMPEEECLHEQEKAKGKTEEEREQREIQDMFSRNGSGGTWEAEEARYERHST